MKPVKIGLLGLGTVGGGTATVLLRNCDEISRRIGCCLEVVHAAAHGIKDQTILASISARSGSGKDFPGQKLLITVV